MSNTVIRGWPQGDSLTANALGWPLGTPMQDSTLPPIGGMLVWYDASDATTITASGGLLAAWNDKSGNSKHATQGNDTFKPGYGSATLNGILVPSWGGGQDWLDAAGIPRSSRQETVFIAGRVDNLGASRCMIATELTGGHEWNINTSGRLEMNADESSVLATHNSATMAVSVPFVASYILTPTTITQRSNGVAETDSNSTAFTNSTNLRIGGDTVLGNVWSGVLAEILIYQGQLQDEDMYDTEQYLRNKWGVA